MTRKSITAPSRQMPGRDSATQFEDVKSCMLCLTNATDRENYAEAMTTMVNDSVKYFIYANELSYEPKTKIPRIFLTFCEKKQGKIDNEPTNFKVHVKLFLETDLNEFGKLLKMASHGTAYILYENRFWMSDGEFPDSPPTFIQMVIYITRPDGGDMPSRRITEIINPDYYKHKEV